MTSNPEYERTETVTYRSGRVVTNHPVVNRDGTTSQRSWLSLGYRHYSSFDEAQAEAEALTTEIGLKYKVYRETKTTIVEPV